MLLDTLHEDFAPLHSSDRPVEEASNQITENESQDPDLTNRIADEMQSDDVRGEDTGSVVTQTFRGMLKNEVITYTQCHLFRVKFGLCTRVGAVSEVSTSLHQRGAVLLPLCASPSCLRAADM